MATTSKKYRKGAQKIAEGTLVWTTDTIKGVLVDLAQYGAQITAASNATPIVVTTSAAHGFTTGDEVLVTGVGGNTAANGAWVITVTDTTHFSLDTSVGNGAYTSGGSAVNITTNEFLSDIPAGARVSTSAALGTKTVTLGVYDAADITFTAVAAGAPCGAIALIKDTGSAATSPLIALVEAATGLPVTPNGGDVLVAWDNGVNKIFKL